jgi:aspartyl-tRNA(Asn)/glutamyl-tRNA(Gln) amidotransferase subunit C
MQKGGICMALERNIIDQIAELSKLHLTEDEKENISAEMENMVLFANKLNELDTSNTMPMYQIVEVKNVFREDNVKKIFDRDKLLQNAPSVENGCFKVPRVVE